MITSTQTVALDPHDILRNLGLEATEVTAVTGGWATSMWRFSSDAQSSALRVYESSDDWPQVRREQSALIAAADAGLPVARVLLTEEWNGRPVVVLSWLDGEPLLTHMQRRPWRVRALGVAFGRMQAALHQVRAPADLEYGAPDYWLGLGADDHDGLLSRVLASRPRTDTLVHLDYHPLNVLSDGKTITGIIDWQSGSAGDPRADLGRTAALLSAAPLPPGTLRPIYSLFRSMFVRGWRAGYDQATAPRGDEDAFMEWGATTFLEDVSRNLENTDSWATEADISAARRWLEQWQPSRH